MDVVFFVASFKNITNRFDISKYVSISLQGELGAQTKPPSNISLPVQVNTITSTSTGYQDLIYGSLAMLEFISE